jgi:hypothetical protein
MALRAEPVRGFHLNVILFAYWADFIIVIRVLEARDDPVKLGRSRPVELMALSTIVHVGKLLGWPPSTRGWNLPVADEAGRMTLFYAHLGEAGRLEFVTIRATRALPYDELLPYLLDAYVLGQISTVRDVRKTDAEIGWHLRFGEFKKRRLSF